VQPSFLSPYTALSLLLLFKQRRIPLTQTQFDQCFDTIVDVLDEANNEKFRLDPTPEG